VATRNTFDIKNLISFELHRSTVAILCSILFFMNLSPQLKPYEHYCPINDAVFIKNADTGTMTPDSKHRERQLNYPENKMV